MSPRAKDPLAAMRKRFVALGYDDAEMIEQMKDPAFRAAFNAPRKLHGSAPPPDAVRLYTLAELPPWVKPQRRVESLTSYFYGRPGVDEITQVVFAIDADGAVFLDLVRHTPKMAKPLFAGDVTPLPGCVLVAVGVEQIRRARAGR